MKKFGLIGFPLSHSFSKKYFTEKFENEKIEGCVYELYEIPEVDKLPQILLQNPELKGINVTIPYKKDVLKFLDEIDHSARKIGAVNVLKVGEFGKIKGFNSDYYGFMESLKKFIGYSENIKIKALILGYGGASLAVKTVLEDLNIDFAYVSRSAEKVREKEQVNCYTYDDLKTGVFKDYKLIINTTPLGMSPNLDASPDIPYQELNSEYFLYDLVYNPEETVFMKKGKEKGANVKNGLEMLVLQAEKSWEIWNS
ncbi:shikimate dehydrogenase family protein [Flexithrix dorotheae]|uniref:shikimate dehydrogenase family protein n=1 Tax=Flexithrix dorotheae TaxID=70993 RepID=UPI000365BBFB|nr:shikimate dehydrogenase [Flexithrix dorotheae]